MTKKDINSDKKDYAEDISEGSKEYYGDNYKVKFKVEKSKKFTKKMLEKLADGIENSYDIDAKKVKAAYRADVKVDVSGKDGFSWSEDTVTIVKIGGSWYVVLGSSTAMVVAAITNSFINYTVAKHLKNKSFSDFAKRSFISTGIAQFVDNLVFASIVSYHFFGWTLAQVLICSLTGAVAELLCEVVFSPIGYRVSQDWEADGVGQQYLNYAGLTA
jgi:hypothetical protein